MRPGRDIPGAAPSFIDGAWYEPASSRRQPAVLSLDDRGQVRIAATGDGRLLAQCPLTALRVPSRLGNSARQLQMHDGGLFETRDNDGLDGLLIGSGQAPHHVVHRMESRWHTVIAALLILIALCWLGLQYGLPFASRQIAQQLPESVSREAARQTLRLLDSGLLEETRLPLRRQHALLERFHGFLDDNDRQWNITFRRGGPLGANAFALPAGTIVLTDELVGLAVHDEELLAVIAHEAGHVMYRHGEQAVIRNSLLVFMAMLLIGDTSGVADLLLGLPLWLVESAYSRDMEREADDFAYSMLRDRGMAPSRFGAIIERIALNARCRAYFDGVTDVRAGEADERMCDTAGGLARFSAVAPEWALSREPDWLGYLSTHPDNGSRRSRFADQGGGFQ